MKKRKLFRPQLRTKNHTADALKARNKQLPLFPYRVVIRLGSVTEVPNAEVEINTAQASKTSSNKLAMKEAFEKLDIKQSLWYTIKNGALYIKEYQADKTDLPYPLIAKKIYGKKGEGMILIHNQAELDNFLKLNTSGYYVEKFYNYAKEYRIHTTLLSPCLYTNRKVRLQNAENKWFFNSTNCNWLLETNPEFDRPKCWQKMVEHAQKALIATGLDIGAVDIRVQSNNKENPDFIVCEINSGPSLGDLTAKHYVSEIPKLIVKKRNG